MTRPQEHEWRASSWQAQSAGTVPVAAPPSRQEDLVLSPEMAEPREPAPQPIPMGSPTPVQAQPPAFEQTAAEPVERTDDTGRSQFFAGRGVKLKAEVSGCDIFRVEGDFEGQVTARRMFISPTGVFKGTGTVEEAEVEGRVEGTLVVTGVLAVRATGRVMGSVSYGQLEIERGGNLHGDIAPRAGEQSSTAPAPKIATSAPPPEPPLRGAPQPDAPAVEAALVRKPLLPPLSFGARRPPN